VNLKFWKKPVSDETEISVTEATLKGSKHVYVKAQTTDKAYDLYQKLAKEK
jgi:hypothetical protein